MLKSISSDLENEELKRQVVAFETGRVHLVTGTLTGSIYAGCRSDAEIGRLASHFYELDADAIESVGIDDLDRTLSSEDLRLRDENFLVDAICALGKENEGYYSLLQHVRIEYVDLVHMNRFLEAVYRNHLDLVVWKSICEWWIF